MLPEQQRISGYFIEEAKDHLNTIEQGLMNLQSTLDDPKMINEVFRAAHSIKGGAAMLGLSSIQHTVHHLEDCFKVLKNHPVKVNQKLESLFLAVCDTLKALLEHLQEPFGLTQETANALISETEPVFKCLHEHLEFLVEQSNDEVTRIDTIPQAAPKKSESWQNLQSLQSQVIRTLREMLQLFKQTATPETRQKLQECCNFLAELGEEFNWFNWCHLCHTAESAIANPKNTYLSLAKIVITDLKKALELVSAGREAEMATSQQLQALARVEKIELLEMPLDLVENLANTAAQQLELPPTFNTFNNMLINQVIPQTTSDAVSTEILEIDLQDRITSLSEISEQLNSNYNVPVTDSSTDTNSPEIDIAEFNSLADLFETESSDLYGTWDKEETLEINAENKLFIHLSNSHTEDSDRKKLLNEQKINPPKEQQFFSNLSQEENLGSTIQKTTHLRSDKILIRKQITVNTHNDSEVTTIKREKIQDEVGSLLELLLDENDFLSRRKINQTQTESIPNIELSNNKKTSFDDFKKSEISRDKNENLTFDDLFGERDLNNSIDLSGESGNKSNYADLFAAMPETEDFSNFWESEIQGRQKGGYYSVDEEETARELEEILLAAAEDIFDDDIEHSLLSISALKLEDLEINLQSEQQFHLIFSSAADENFLEALSPIHPTISSSLDTSIDTESIVDYKRVSSTEKSGFSQQPEGLELTPEFTNLLLETAQASSELKIEFVDVENENTLPLFLEETPTVSSNDVILFDSTESSFADEQQDFLNNLLFTQPPEGISFTLTSEHSPIQAHLETVDIQAETISQTDEGLLEAQQNLEDNLSKVLATIDTEDTAFVLTGTMKSTETVSSEEELSQKMKTSLNEEFAELDKLLDLEVVLNVSTENRPEEVPAQVKLPSLVSDQVISDTAKQEINFGFQELKEMVKGLPPRYPSVSRPAKFEQLMKVPVRHLDDLSNLVGELIVNRNTLEQDQERLRQFLDNLLDQVQQLSDVGARMQELYDRSLLEASLLDNRRNSINNSGYNHQDTDRGFTELEMDRLTPFRTLSLEMIELIVRVRETANDINIVTEDSEQVARQFRQVTHQLQEGITRSRMQSFADVTTALERGVRESAIKCGKQAQLNVQGRETLIDKVILEHLKSPLMHLLNNAIAHGIETPEVRQAQGKPPVGAITVHALHQGNQTVISVTDDGAGIDIEQVKAKAIKMGIRTPEQAKTLSVLDVYDLLFLPGFSTKEQEDELAGRGIGLDVVRTKMTEIRGTINIDSIVGKGTTFTLRLPLTLSICKALCCVFDQACIAFPIDSVEDSLDVPVQTIQQGADGQNYIPWRDTLLPLRSLKEILTFNRQISRSSVYSGHRDDEMICVVVVRSANVLIALQVDQVLNEQEIVIKQFEGPAPKPIGVAGATILGDGRIMPIADVLEIIDIFQGKTSK